MLNRIPKPPENLPEDWILVGRATRPQALRGAFRLQPEVDDPEAVFQPGSTVCLMTESGAKRFEVERVENRPKFVVLKLAGVDSVEQAERLRGQLLYMPEAELPELPGDSFYYFELQGCQVVLPDETVLGEVREVQPGPTGDMLLIRRGEKEYLIPAVTEIVRSIDLDEGVIRIEPPEGLLQA